MKVRHFLKKPGFQTGRLFGGRGFGVPGFGGPCPGGFMPPCPWDCSDPQPILGGLLTVEPINGTCNFGRLGSEPDAPDAAAAPFGWIPSLGLTIVGVDVPVGVIFRWAPGVRAGGLAGGFAGVLAGVVVGGVLGGWARRCHGDFVGGSAGGSAFGLLEPGFHGDLDGGSAGSGALGLLESFGVGFRKDVKCAPAALGPSCFLSLSILLPLSKE